jgi:hypothetical protein
MMKRYEQVIRNGDNLIALWGNDSGAFQNAGTILGEIKEVEIDGIPTYITPPHPLWHLDPGELQL